MCSDESTSGTSKEVTTLEDKAESSSGAMSVPAAVESSEMLPALRRPGDAKAGG